MLPHAEDSRGRVAFHHRIFGFWGEGRNFGLFEPQSVSGRSPSESMMYYSIPGLYPLEASSTNPHLRLGKNVLPHPRKVAQSCGSLFPSRKGQVKGLVFPGTTQDTQQAGRLQKSIYWCTKSSRDKSSLTFANVFPLQNKLPSV